MIPEVNQLITKELSSLGKLDSQTKVGPNKQMLCDIVAWLVVNSMRSEQLQWSMLCCQNVANIYRKNAFANLGALLDSSTKMVGTSGSSATGKNNRNPYLRTYSYVWDGVGEDGPGDPLEVFDEPIDFPERLSGRSSTFPGETERYA